MSELQPPRPTASAHRALWLPLATVILAAGIGMWIHFRPPSTSQFDPIVKQLAAGQFEPVLGRVDLSRSFPGITPRDEFFLTRRDDGSFLALFPDYYAKGPAIAGLMYTSRPLTEKDTFNTGTSIGFDHPRISVGSWHHLVIDNKVNDHWYRVSYGLH